MIRDECKQFIMNLGQDQEVRRGFIELFEAFSNEPGAHELPAITYVLPCYDENTEFQPGDWAPEIHLVLRKIADEYHEEPETEDISEAEEPAGP